MLPDQSLARDLPRVAAAIELGSDLFEPVQRGGMVVLEQIAERDEVGGFHVSPAVPGPAGELRGAHEPWTRRGWCGRRLHEAQRVQRPGRRGVVAGLFGESQRGGGVRAAGVEVAAGDGHVGAPPERRRPPLGRGCSRRLQRTRVEAFHLGIWPAEHPPPVQGRAQPERVIGARPGGVLDGGDEVRRVHIEHVEPPPVAGPLEVRRDLLRHRSERVPVPITQPGLLPSGRQTLKPVLPDGFDEPVPRRGVALLDHHQRAVDQRGQQVEHGVAVDAVAGTDRLDGVQGCSHR